MQSENTALVLGVTLNLKYFHVIYTYVSGVLEVLISNHQINVCAFPVEPVVVGLGLVLEVDDGETSLRFTGISSKFIPGTRHERKYVPNN